MAVADTIDLEEYCLVTARRARRASHQLARIGGGQKNAWLLRRRRCCAVSGPGWPRRTPAIWRPPPQYGLTECADRSLAAYARRHRIDGRGTGRNRGAGRTDRRSDRVVHPPQRLGSSESARAAGSGVFHLRIASQRHRRRRRHLHQKRQRRDFARRQGGRAFQSGHRGAVGASRRRSRPAGRVRSIGLDDRPRGGGALPRPGSNISTWRFPAEAKV